MTLKETLIDKLNGRFPGVNFDFSEYKGELSCTLDKQHILEVSRFLKTDPELQFNLCEDVTAVDWAKRTDRFTVVYHIFSISNKYRLRLKVPLKGNDSDASVDSVASVWATANWHERETFDMYGIVFNNHPDLRRMYMPEDFEYHPLRKDFPLMGIPGSLSLPKK